MFEQPFDYARCQLPLQFDLECPGAVEVADGSGEIENAGLQGIPVGGGLRQVGELAIHFNFGAAHE